MSSDNYLLTKQEFLLIAAAAGIEKLYGFDLQTEEPDREEALYLLQELTKKGYLRVENGQFVPDGVMGDIFDHIREADTTLEVSKRSGRKCLLYAGEQMVRMVPSMRRPQVYEVGMMPMNETWQYLKEEGWIRGSESEQWEELV